MIVEKEINFNFYDIDNVVLELAKEINNGFTISYVKQTTKFEDLPISCDKIYYRPVYKAVLRKKDGELH